MSCNCEGNTYNIGMGCCKPVLGPIENYYTKSQVDSLISGITVSGVTEEVVDEKIESATSGLASELWVTEQGYLTPSDVDSELNATSTNPIENKAVTEALNGKLDESAYTPVDLSNYATKAWVENKEYISNSEFVQYINNLQEQINSIIASVSGCCGSSGETIYRWITMVGENDYICSGTTKYSKEKEQSSDDNGMTWTDTGNYRQGSTVLEINSTDCGYVPPIVGKLICVNNSGETYTLDCDGDGLLTKESFVADYYTKMGKSAASTVAEANIGDCVTTLSGQAFQYMNVLSSVTISNSVVTIGNSSFEHCGKLTGITIPNSVTTIGNYALHDNTAMTYVSIGNNVTVIGAYAFDGGESITSITIPDSVTSIGVYAFRNCSAATSVTIGSGITNIESTAFYDCSSLSSIKVNATTPPTLGLHAFHNTNDCPIYVPAESVDAYKAASNWSDYATRIQAIS